MIIRRAHTEDVKNIATLVVSLSHLYHLFVSKAHQGKGIVNTLWQNVVKQNKVKKYTLRSSLYAVPVYKKWGFVETDIVRENDGIKFQAMALITK